MNDRQHLSAEALEAAAIIGLGANLDNPLGMIRTALTRLGQTPGVSLLAVSSVYLTEPQGGPRGQNWYHNAAALLNGGEMTPKELLRLLLAIEADLGRQRLVYCGPRVIDLDLLAWGRAVIDDPPELILPHPRMEQRLFVMAPLAELWPDWLHPVLGRRAADLLADIPAEGQGLVRLEEAVISW